MPYTFLALFQLVFICCLQDDPAQAKRYCFELWALGKDTGSPLAAGFALWGFGLADCFGGESARGVRLLAAFETSIRQGGLKISIEDDPNFVVYRQTLDKAQAQLGAAAFQAAWTAGQQMTLERAIALATDDESGDAPLPSPLHAEQRG